MPNRSALIVTKNETVSISVALITCLQARLVTYEVAMKYFKLVTLLCLNFVYARAASDYGILLESQFLDLKQEVSISKKNGEKLDVIYQEEAQQKEWYETMIALDTRSIAQSWINISNGSEIFPNHFEHGFYVSHCSAPLFVQKDNGFFFSFRR